MQTVASAERTLTDLDHARVSRLLRVARDMPQANLERSIDSVLDEALDRADLVTSRTVPPDVVTMNSHVSVKDMDTGERHRWTLCYPSRADFQGGFISVLSPVGAALLGLRVGSTARWTTPGGVRKSAEVLAIFFQPESSGDYVL